MHVRVGLALATTIVMLGAAACGSSGPEVSSRTPPRAPATANHSGGQTVTYQGVQFDVPAGWPVHDLAADPSTCVRYDVHAVYLGHAGADMHCPAHLSGRTETVQLEPADGDQAATLADGATVATVNDLSVAVDEGTPATHEVTVSVTTAGVVGIITYGDAPAAAQQILETFRSAAG